MKKIILTVAFVLVTSSIFGMGLEGKIQEKNGKYYYVAKITSDRWHVFNTAIVDGTKQKAKLVDSEMLIIISVEYRAVEIELKEQTIVFKGEDGQMAVYELTQVEIEAYNK